MDTPEFMRLTEEQQIKNMRLVRFKDQIILLNRAGMAERRSFFPSVNSAKRANRYFKRLPELKHSPQNTTNCLNEMVPEAAPTRPTKAEERLDVRIRDFNSTVARSKRDGAEYTRPGSMKGRM